MDTRSNAEIEQLVGEIRAYMPETYASIKAKAESIGNQAFALVRAGLRGEPNKFWAMEKGRVMGTPFNLDIMAEVAKYMVSFGCAHVCIWPDADQAAGEASHGAH